MNRYIFCRLRTRGALVMSPTSEWGHDRVRPNAFRVPRWTMNERTRSPAREPGCQAGDTILRAAPYGHVPGGARHHFKPMQLLFDVP